MLWSPPGAMLSSQQARSHLLDPIGGACRATEPAGGGGSMQGVTSLPLPTASSWGPGMLSSALAPLGDLSRKADHSRREGCLGLYEYLTEDLEVL